jgi:hypothetical protein
MEESEQDLKKLARWLAKIQAWDGIIPLPWRPSPKSVDLASTVTALPAPLVTQTTTVKHSA